MNIVPIILALVVAFLLWRALRSEHAKEGFIALRPEVPSSTEDVWAKGGILREIPIDFL